MSEDEEAGERSELWIQLGRIDEGGPVSAGRLQQTAISSAKTAAKVTDEMVSGVSDSLKKVCQMVSGAFDAVNRPDELVVKFGLKVATKGKTNVFVVTAEATGEATLAVEAKWTNPKPTTGTPKPPDPNPATRNAP